MALRWARDRKTILDRINADGMTKLNLSGQKIGPAAVSEIAIAVEANTSIVSLVLNSNVVQDSGALALASMLYKNTTLEELILGNNEITDKGANEILDAVERSSTNLKKLGMQYNELTPAAETRLRTVMETKAGKPSRDDLLEAASNSTWSWKIDNRRIQRELMKDSLLVLKLNNQKIDVEGAFVIAECLSQNTSLQYLFLATNQIGRQGAQAIFSSIDANEKSGLTLLDLKWNGIDSHGVTNALNINRTLETLTLAGNEIGDIGISGLVNTSGRAGCTLVELDLSNNLLSNEGCAKGLAPWLESNLTCKRLNLSTNRVGDFGASSIADALVLNWRKAFGGDCGIPLEHLDLAFNLVGPKGGEALKVALEKAKYLKYVDLRHNKMTESELVTMFRCVRIQQEMPDMKDMRQGNEKLAN